MNILVLGGTGAMGIHLVKILSDVGHKVVVTSRENHKDTDTVSYVKGNAHDNKFMKQVLAEKDYDAVVDFMSYKTDEFKDKYYILLDNTQQYVYLSSARVFADSLTPIVESSPRLLDVCTDKEYISTDEYALTKARQENLLLESGKNNWTIIRPYITYSENRLQLGVLEKESWLYRALHGRTILFSQDIASHTTTMTYGYDVARGIASIIGKESAFGESFNITGEESIRWIDLLKVYLDEIEEFSGTRPKVKIIQTARNVNRGMAKYQVIYDRYYDRTFDNQKIGQYIDIRSFVNLHEGVRRCVEHLCANHNFKAISLRNEFDYNEITHENISLKELLQTGGYKGALKYGMMKILPNTIKRNIR